MDFGKSGLSGQNQRTPRPEQNAGKEEYVVYAYENFKILITELKNPPFVIGVKLPRAVNLEYVMNKVLLPYR